jgi:hypothetical protein
LNIQKCQNALFLVSFSGMITLELHSILTGGKNSGVYYKSNFRRKMISYCYKNGGGSRPAFHWCTLFVYEQPVSQHGSKICAFIICEDYHFMKYGDLSSLEEYFFLHSWPSPIPFKVMAMAKRRKKKTKNVKMLHVIRLNAAGIDMDAENQCQQIIKNAKEEGA